MAGQKREAGRAAGYKLLIFGILTLCVILIAVFAPYLTPYDPYAQDLSNALQPPGPGHLLGTDRYGRDMLSRVIMGSRTTIFSALLLVAIITLAGGTIGIVCGYYGGKLDSFLKNRECFKLKIGVISCGGERVKRRRAECGDRAGVYLLAQICPYHQEPGAGCEGRSLYYGGQTVRFRYVENHPEAYHSQYCRAGHCDRGSGYRDDDHGDIRTFFPGTGSGSAHGRMGIHDEQRKKHAPDRALGDPFAGMRDLSDGYGF